MDATSDSGARPIYVHYVPLPLRDAGKKDCTWIVHGHDSCRVVKHVDFRSLSSFSTFEGSPPDQKCSCTVAAHHLRGFGKVVWGSNDVATIVECSDVTQEELIPSAAFRSEEKRWSSELGAAKAQIRQLQDHARQQTVQRVSANERLAKVELENRRLRSEAAVNIDSRYEALLTEYQGLKKLMVQAGLGSLMLGEKWTGPLEPAAAAVIKGITPGWANAGGMGSPRSMLVGLKGCAVPNESRPSSAARPTSAAGRHIPMLGSPRLREERSSGAEPHPSCGLAPSPSPPPPRATVENMPATEQDLQRRHGNGWRPTGGYLPPTFLSPRQRSNPAEAKKVGHDVPTHEPSFPTRPPRSAEPRLESSPRFVLK